MVQPSQPRPRQIGLCQQAYTFDPKGAVATSATAWTRQLNSDPNRRLRNANEIVSLTLKNTSMSVAIPVTELLERRRYFDVN
jgi:hypothetical protein